MFLDGKHNPEISLDCYPNATTHESGITDYPKAKAWLLSFDLFLAPDMVCTPDCAEKVSGDIDGCGGVCMMD